VNILEEKMTLYFTSAPRFNRRPWAHRWVEPEMQESHSDLFIPVDVKANENDYVLTALIPGENDQYLLSELPSGRFSRSLTLPDQLDAGKAEADVSNGILTLRIPKAEDAKPKSIKVVAK
jgi:HSP20 family molecular chaperone IbpA